MGLLGFKVLPKAGTEYAKKYSGASIVYLVNTKSKTDADSIARKNLEENEWIITDAYQEIREISRDSCSDKLLQTYKKQRKMEMHILL